MAATDSPPSTRVKVPFVEISASIYTIALMHGIPQRGRCRQYGGLPHQSHPQVEQLHAYALTLLRPCAVVLLRSFALARKCLPASLSASLSICAPVAPNYLTTCHFDGYHLRKIAQVTY